MIEVVKHQGKWYSQNNRRLWCFKEAAISVVKARIGQEDNHFLRRVNTVSDGWTVNFFPPCICKKCSIEFPNRKELRWHACKEVMKTSALDWEDQVSEASDDSCSEDGDYGEDGFWTERRICVFAVFLCCVVGIVAVGVVGSVVVAVVVVVVLVLLLWLLLFLLVLTTSTASITTCINTSNNNFTTVTTNSCTSSSTSTSTNNTPIASTPTTFTTITTMSEFFSSHRTRNEEIHFCPFSFCLGFALVLDMGCL